VHDLRTPEDVSRRFYFNQPTAAEDAWVTPMEWAALADATRVVADGEDVVLFFDGSKSRDATALVGCCMSDGYIFTVNVWEPTRSTPPRTRSTRSPLTPK
jgi:phage terminase large subunit-like protein